MITVEQLQAVCPRLGDRAAHFIAPLNSTFELGIDNKERMAAFLGQYAHESAEFTRLEENLNYSAEGILRTWPNRFTAELAVDCAHHPERIASIAYADRMGNGDAQSGDGWLYHGRGLPQLTGKANYRACSIAICGDADTLLTNPELLLDPDYACLAGGWYWQSHELNRFADNGDFEGLTKAINGGMNGFPDRVMYWKRALAALA